jgi:hypothetical protein
VGRSEATRVKRTSRKGTLAHFYVAVVKPPAGSIGRCNT